jgi:hypothetical protein
MKQENTPFGGWLKRKLLLICIKSKKVRTRTRRGITFQSANKKETFFLNHQGKVHTYILLIDDCLKALN